MSYRYIDLFAGIGGFHLAFKENGMECVFASEMDKSARETYIKNHHINESIFNDDIRKINPEDIPDHDILCAGFPCQPFSQAGYKKGFKDGNNSERGNLFFCIADILNAKKPRAFILENVRHLLKHDDGKTFEIIKQTLEDLNYSVYYKIIKASDFGKPQHRPRIYIIGFNNELVSKNNYEFPHPIPLKKTMSDIWEGQCEREIGFTLRVGGRGSSINDRRNWDSYRVDGEVKQLTPLQGKRMMGFPDDFSLPNTITQSMKQLGNSVCVNVVSHLSKSIKKYLDENSILLNVKDNIMMNKGEWSELYTFFKLIIDNKLYFSDEVANKSDDYVTVIEIAHNKNDLIYKIAESEVVLKDKNNNHIKSIKISSIITVDKIEHLLNKIKNSSGRSFDIPEFKDVLLKAEINQYVNGSSYEKGDLQIAFDYNQLSFPLSPVGIKSDLGAKPTLLNASSATNFVFKINGFKGSIDEINAIETRSKIKDRINEIQKLGGNIFFSHCEVNTYKKNLMMIDSNMPNILAEILLKYYLGYGSKFSDLVTDHIQRARVESCLRAILLGMFSSSEWDGYESSTGSILVKNDGELRFFHVIKDEVMKKYLFNHTKLDTPSSTRHRFGTVYKEKDSLFIKLNLQIRML